MKKIDDGGTDTKTIGRYQLSGDTIRITTMNGGTGMNFVVTISTSVMQLDGTFPISSENTRRPTFFLSREKVNLETNGIAVFPSEGQILYRNVLNTVTVSPLQEGEIVECPYCDTIYKGESDNEYIIVPGLGSISQVIVRDSSMSQVISKTTLKNFHLPNPVLYFGSAKNGVKSSKRSSTIYAKYPPEMNLDFESTIVKWDVFIDGNMFSGVGNKRSTEAAEFLENHEGDGAICILAVVRTADGIGRQIGGAFKL